MAVKDLPAEGRHCTICQSPYIEMRDVHFIYSNESQFCYLPVKLACDHVFGRRCIEEWLKTPAARRTCPCCRADPSDGPQDPDRAYDADNEGEKDSDDDAEEGIDNQTDDDDQPSKSKECAAPLVSKGRRASSTRITERPIAIRHKTGMHLLPGAGRMEWFGFNWDSSCVKHGSHAH